MKTTLKAIRSHKPCKSGWGKLLNHLGKTRADDEPLLIRAVLDSNGLDDALWCLRATTGYDREIRLYAVWCAQQVEHLMTDQRSKDALKVAKRFAEGKATQDELGVAWSGALAAEFEAEQAVQAAKTAEWAAAKTATWAAARAAQSEWEAAWAAAWEAAKAAQEKKFRAVLKRIEKQEAA